ncbi:hypothetical protein ABVT39_026862 [Epinephelus coioides]
MAIWNDGTEDQLITMIQERPALYDITAKRYANQVYTRYKKLAPSGSVGAQKTGRQQWILTRLQLLEPYTKRKETSSNLTIVTPSDWTSTSEEPCFFAEHRPSTPLAEFTICGAESAPTPTREDPLPSTSSQSSTLKPQVKRSRKMLDESVSKDSSHLMRTIGQTLEKLASQEESNDAIHAYCKNIEHRMRNLPPHLLPYFQHDVDNCLFKYSVDQNLASETSDRQFRNL